MPDMNIYTTQDRVKPLEKILGGLRSFVAKELSGQSITLQPTEVSVRVIVPAASTMIGNTEFDIFAYNFPERAERQDQICLSVRDYITQACPQAGEVYGWLKLCELGHSTQ